MKLAPVLTRRPAFTLIELLVVIGIIAVMVALTVGALVGIINAFTKRSTEVVIRKTSDAVQQQLRAISDQAKESQVPPGVVLMAGGDEKRARVMWAKLNFKKEFPQCYAEALQPHLAYMFDPNTNTIVSNAANPCPYLTATDLPPRGDYQKALQGVSSTGNYDAEMGAMLLLALSQTRRGSAFKPDESLGPTALQDTDNDGLKEIVDTFGYPLAFYRWPVPLPYPNDIANSRGNAADRDPQDPDRRLQDASWNNQQNWNNRQGVYWFHWLCHPVCFLQLDPNGVPDPWNLNKWSYVQAQAFYMVPVVASAGPNRKFGVRWGAMQPFSADANDNIYSYLLK